MNTKDSKNQLVEYWRGLGYVMMSGCNGCSVMNYIDKELNMIE